MILHYYLKVIVIVFLLFADLQFPAIAATEVDSPPAVTTAALLTFYLIAFFRYAF